MTTTATKATGSEVDQDADKFYAPDALEHHAETSPAMNESSA